MLGGYSGGQAEYLRVPMADAYTKPLLEKIEAGEIDPSFVARTQSVSKRRPRCTRLSGQERWGYQGGVEAG